MTARDSIENLWDRAIPVAPLLDKFRAQCRHEAAEEQRAALLSDGYDLTCPCNGCTACLVRDVINLINPEETP